MAQIDDPRYDAKRSVYETPRDTRSNSSLWILGAALAAILIIVGLLGMRTSTPTLERNASVPTTTTTPATPPAAVPAPVPAPATPANPAPAAPRN